MVMGIRQLIRNRREELVLQFVQLAKTLRPGSFARQRQFDLLEPPDAHAIPSPTSTQTGIVITAEDNRRRCCLPGRTEAQGRRRRQGRHGGGRARRMGYADPHESDHEEDAVGVKVGPSEDVPQSNQGERGRHDPEAGPPGPSLPWREPDRCTQRQRRSAHCRRCCCIINPGAGSGSVERDPAAANPQRTSPPGARKPSPACGPVVQGHSTGAGRPIPMGGVGPPLSRRSREWPHGRGQRPMQLALARCCSPRQPGCASPRLPHHQSAVPCVWG